MARVPRTTTERNPEQTRSRVLLAAEQLFAEQGFDQTSLADVGRLAGVSRATPGYFFGSKADLYRAVLESCFQKVREAVRTGRERSRVSEAPPEVILSGAVADYSTFLEQHPHFVRLMEREALAPSASGTEGDIPPRLAAGQEALEAIVDELGLTDENRDAAAHLLVSLVALCWFPLVHATTLVRATGLDPSAPGYAESRRRHVVDLILHGVRDSLHHRAVSSRTAPVTTGACP
jgi:AcrR family transcriptional regulator